MKKRIVLGLFVIISLLTGCVGDRKLSRITSCKAISKNSEEGSILEYYKIRIEVENPERNAEDIIFLTGTEGISIYEVGYADKEYYDDRTAIVRRNVSFKDLHKKTYTFEIIVDKRQKDKFDNLDTLNNEIKNCPVSIITNKIKD